MITVFSLQSFHTVQFYLFYLILSILPSTNSQVICATVLIASLTRLYSRHSHDVLSVTTSRFLGRKKAQCSKWVYCVHRRQSGLN